MPRMPLVDLEARIDYVFTQKSLLRQAMTHRSHSAANNERLELLGDAVLDLIVTEHLFNAFPEAKEGQLSRFRARLVRKQTLAALARELGLSDFLIMGEGELRSGGYNRESTLSDSFEALIGAIYLDGGIATVTERVSTWYADRWDGLSLSVSHKDAKTRLQEHLQSIGRSLPVYRVVSTTGSAHAQTFKVSCDCESLPAPTVGEGRNRRIAEQMAAEAALASFGLNVDGVADE